MVAEGATPYFQRSITLPAEVRKVPIMTYKNTEPKAMPSSTVAMRSTSLASTVIPQKYNANDPKAKTSGER